MTRCTCAVDGCSNSTYENPQLKFFRLPQDPVKARRWMKLIGREDAKMSVSHHVCEEHFTADHIYRRGVITLTKNAVPSLKLPPTSVKPIVMLHKSTQCKPLETTSKPPKKRDVVCEFTTTRKSRGTFYELCDRYLGSDIAHIVKTQANILKKLSEERRGECDFFYFCLKLYYTNPANYLALRKSLNLPNKQTLSEKLMESIESNHNTLFKALKAKVECMSDIEKHCTILIGFVDVKPHLFYHINNDKIYGFTQNYGFQNRSVSDNAIAIFVRGIYEPWVLAIDYALFSKSHNVPLHCETLSSWVGSNIKNLLATGLNIRVCISNLSPNIIAAKSTTQTATPSVKKPYFIFNDQRIYYMVDPTYTLKKIHSCFMEYEFQFKSSVAKWQDVVEFYNIDRNNKYRLAPKLTEEHVKCSSYDKPYPIVVDMFNQTVAAGIATYIQFGVLDPSAWGTVRFISIMSNLIDFTHSCNAPHSREFKKPFEGSETQMESLMEALDSLRHMRLYKSKVDVTDNVECVTDLRIAIKSLLMLSDDLKSENNPNLFTRYINFNVMARFFRSVSKKNLKTGKLLPWKLCTEFRSMFFRNILQTPKFRPCPEIFNGIFFDYLNSLSMVDQDVKPIISKAVKPFKVGSLVYPVRISDYKHFKLPSKDQLTAIGIFVLNKCLEMHVVCTLPTTSKGTEDGSSVSRYPQYKYDPVTKKLIPDHYFMLFLGVLENELKNYFNTNFLNAFFMMRLGHMSDSTIESFRCPCFCFPVKYLSKLYYRIRLSQILKINNKTFERNSEKMTFSYKALL